VRDPFPVFDLNPSEAPLLHHCLMHQTIRANNYPANRLCADLSWFPAAEARLLYIPLCLRFYLPVDTPGSLSGYYARRNSTPHSFLTHSSLDLIHSQRSGWPPSYPRAQILLGIWTIVHSGIFCLARSTRSRIFPKKGWMACRKSILHTIPVPSQLLIAN